MDTEEINEKLKKYRDCFVGTYPCDLLPKVVQRPAAIIANTDPAHKPGEHWVALWLNANGTGEYFDSFGLPPLNSNILRYIREECPNGVTHLNVMLQNVLSITCGNYCVLYVKMKCLGFSLDEFLQLFSRFTLSNDKVIEKLYSEL